MDEDYVNAEFLHYTIAVGESPLPGEWKEGEEITIETTPKTLTLYMVYTCKCTIEVSLGSGTLNPDVEKSLFDIIDDKNSETWTRVSTFDNSAKYFSDTVDTPLYLPVLKDCAKTVVRDDYYFNGFKDTKVNGNVNDTVTVTATYEQYTLKFDAGEYSTVPNDIKGAGEKISLPPISLTLSATKSYDGVDCELKGWSWDEENKDTVYASKDCLDLLSETDLAGKRKAYVDITRFTEVTLPKFAPTYENDWEINERTVYGVWYQYAHIVKWGQDK